MPSCSAQAMSGAAARNLVMLDRLCAGEKAGVMRIGFLELLHHFLAFFDKAKNGRAGLAARRLFKQFEYLFQPFDAGFGFYVVLLESSAQFFECAAFAIFGSATRIFFSAK